MMINILTADGYANTYIIGDSGKQCIVIDPGYNDNLRINDFIHKHYSGVAAILLTHGHYDHIAGINNLVKEYPCQIMIHESEIEKLSNPRLNVSGVKNPIIVNSNSLYPLEDGDEIKIIGLTIKVIHTPFHTNGSVCYYIKSLNSLFSGDTLFHLSIGRSDLPTGSYKTIKDSLLKLSILPPETIVFPGHGEKTNIGNELKYNDCFKN
jgi:glyoxylase-like metal-dependent hydrolase (beta-lactamase superfamily II)